MFNALIDGVGTGTRAQVDNTNKLSTRSVSSASELEATLDGNNFFITPGVVTLTSDSKSALLYFENQDEEDLIIYSYNIGVGDSTGGTRSYIELDTRINTTGMSGGTGTNVGAINVNLKSFNTLTVSNSEIGQEGAALTGAVLPPVRGYIPTGLSTVLEVNVVLPKGSTFAFEATPPPSNTSIDVIPAFNCYKLKNV